MSEQSLEFYAVCPAGFEPIVAEELKSLSVRRIRPLKGGVAFFGSVKDGLRASLWLRCASRVLLVLTRVDATTADTLYEEVRAFPWQDHLSPESTISISARGTNAHLRNTQFTAQKVKDAICDHMRAQCGMRPEVSKERPDFPLNVSIHSQRATIALDFAGESLHKRGYRLEGENVEAPLKEVLAAGVLYSSPWNKTLEEVASRPQKSKDYLLFDPFCGSGTLVIEAAMMAADMAPGIMRDYWGFTGWKQFNQADFDELLAEADKRLEAGLQHMPLFCGSDANPQAIEIARKQAARARLADHLSFTVANCENMDQTLREVHCAGALYGCIVGNPPYGVRLMSKDLDMFYEALQKGLSKVPSRWTLTVITPDEHFDEYVGASSFSTVSAYNGAIETTIRSYQIGAFARQFLDIVTLPGKEITVPVLSDHPDQFANRLRKNVKQRRKWAQQRQIQAFRIYDADLPDYAVAIDLFLGSEDAIKEKNPAGLAKHAFDTPYVLISEYQAGRDIDPRKAFCRFKDAVRITSALLEIPSSQVFTRVRKRDRGGGQYGHMSKVPKRVLTKESGLVFELDLESYVDVGLFLDHRITRQFIAAQAKGKDVLNLFAYTGSASVYAAAGGAKSVTTVDLSKTYIDWAKRNMAYNGFSAKSNRFIQADVREWLRAEKDPKQCKDGKVRRYDLIFVDPPTFSNSKSMGKLTWDIQRDHFYLLRDISKLLRNNGVIIFSGNLRSFKLDEKVRSELGFDVLDITAKTIPEDFARNKKIHFCYILQQRATQARTTA